jgi:hypothetical protein
MSFEPQEPSISPLYSLDICFFPFSLEVGRPLENLYPNPITHNTAICELTKESPYLLLFWRSCVQIRAPEWNRERSKTDLKTQRILHKNPKHLLL